MRKQLNTEFPTYNQDAQTRLSLTLTRPHPVGTSPANVASFSPDFSFLLPTIRGHGHEMLFIHRPNAGAGAAAYGQQTVIDSQGATPDQTRPEPTVQRLEQLRKTADELQKTGKWDEAWAALRQVDQERMALMHKYDALQAEARQLQKAIGPTTQILLHLQVFEVSLDKLQSAGLDPAKLFGEPGPKAKKQSVGWQIYSVFHSQERHRSPENPGPAAQGQLAESDCRAELGDAQRFCREFRLGQNDQVSEAAARRFDGDRDSTGHDGRFLCPRF